MKVIALILSSAVTIHLNGQAIECSLPYDQVLCTMGKECISLDEFKFIVNASKHRLPLNEQTLNEWLNLYINYRLKIQEAKTIRLDTTLEVINDYNQYIAKLPPELSDETKYSLKEEYMNGVLLFHLSDIQVWNKAVQDSIGMKSYYEENKSSWDFKPLSEVKDSVINDYQEFLEKQWMINLRQKYPVVVNEKVLNTLIGY